ncbi:MAG TPA: hypothetical protein VGX48_24795 [Pyrinomonadaceae bacterium]|jgi:hypothetical protein|nr:hypothetical protein [Pyrinomonadaceae bacterium]
MESNKKDKVKRIVVTAPPGTGKTYTLLSGVNVIEALNENETRSKTASDSADGGIGVKVIVATTAKVNEWIRINDSRQKSDTNDSNTSTLREPENTAKDTQVAEAVERLLRLLINKQDREAVIGDLFEKYEREVERRGKRRADYWLYHEIFRSAWPLLMQLVVRIGGRITRAKRAE